MSRTITTRQSLIKGHNLETKLDHSCAKFSILWHISFRADILVNKRARTLLKRSAERNVHNRPP